MMRQFPVGTLTLLFTDIEGSTRLLRKLGSQYADVLRECRRLMRAAFAHSNGFEVDTQGDAFFVVFERASDAIMAAVIAQHSLTEAHWPGDVTVRVRMGLHTGEPQAVEEGYIGLDVHHAARIMSAAHGGQVLISKATHDLVASDLPDEVSMQDLGAYRLKDIPGQSELFQLVIAGLPSIFPPPTHSRRSLRNIPRPSASFVGREQEVVILCQQLLRPAVRLLTLIGIGGVGKTRLALQVASTLAEQFAGDVCFVALEEAHNADQVISTLARTLGIQEEQGTPLIEQIKAVLADQPLLLVLDNFEHVLSARLAISELLTGCPGVKILVTSRTMLHLQAEHLFEVLPLPLPDTEQETDLASLAQSAAITLFVQRAQALQPSFELTAENAPDILRLCNRLDGIPLAIELAAAQSRYFTPAQLLMRQQQESMHLQGKIQDIPARQRTLQHTIDWSYDLLDPAEQSVFRRLSICPAGTTLEAAEQICTAAGSLDQPIAEVLENLVDKSMLQRRGSASGEPRFWLLRTLRTYGSARLTEAGEEEATLTALSRYSVSRCESIAPRLAGAEQTFWLDQVDQEHENIRVACAWLLDEHNPDQTRIEHALRLGVALMRYWEIRGYFEEGATLMTQALASDLPVPAAVKAQALHSAGFLALMLSRITQAETFLRESQILFRESGDKAAMASILRLQGNVALSKSSYKVARRLLEEALTIDREVGNIRRAASTRIALAQVAIAQGSYSKAYTLLEENLAEFSSLGEQHSTAYPLYYMARTLFLADQDLVKALELVKDSLNLFRAVGNRRLVAHALDLQANILLGRKDKQTALLLDESSQLFKAVGDPAGRAEVLISQGRLASSRNSWASARACFEESLAILKQLDAKDLIAPCLEGYGSVLVAQQESLRAIQCWGLAATIRSTIVAPMPPIYRSPYRLTLALVRAQINPAQFQDAWNSGGQATLAALLG